MIEPVGLGKRAIRGAASTGAGQLVRVGIQLVGIVVLARLLDPADFGLVAMVTAIVGIAEVIRDFGLSSAAVQAVSVSRSQQTNLFWINTVVGLLLSVVVFALAMPIAGFYGRPQLIEIIQLISVTFFLGGISAQFRANLLRSLRFGSLVTADISGQALGLGIAISLAQLDFGYWALAWQQITQATVMLIFVMVASRWLPGLPRRRTDIKSFFSFGIYFMLTQMLVYISSNISSVAIGKIFGPVQLGIYSRAFQVFSLPLNQISAPATNVALPILSRIYGEHGRFNRFLVYGQIALSNPVIAMYAFGASQAHFLTRQVFGAEWLGMVPVLQALAVGGAVQVLTFSTYWVFISTGQTKSNFIFAMVTRTSLTIAVLVGATFGPTICALAYAASMVVIWPFGLYWIRKFDGVLVGGILYAGIRTLAVYGASGVLSLMAALYFDNSIIGAIVGLVLFIAVTVACYCLSNSYKNDVKNLAQDLKLIQNRKRSATA